MLRAPDGFAATVVPAAASATLSYAHGAGLAGGVAGETQSFRVALCDVYGNPIDGRHASIERALAVRVTREGAPGEAPAPIDVTEVERGVVQIDWCAPRAGSYAVSLAAGGESFVGFPRHVALRPARPFAAACVASAASRLPRSPVCHTLKRSVSLKVRWSDESSARRWRVISESPRRSLVYCGAGRGAPLEPAPLSATSEARRWLLAVG